MSEQLPAPIPLPELSAAQLAALAREVVMEIRELRDILPTFGITPAQYARLAEHPTYKRIHDAIAIDWHGATNTERRIKISAAAILENSLPMLGARIGAVKEPLREAIEGAKLFARMAGVTYSEPETAREGKFVINIDLGADSKLRFEKEVGGKKEVLPEIKLKESKNG
jgi:hypothetical protein